MYSYVSLPEGRFPKRQMWQMCQFENNPNHQRRKIRIFRALLDTFLCSATLCQPLVSAKPAKYANAVRDFRKAKLSWTCWSYLKTTTLYQGQEVAFGDLTHPPLVHPITSPPMGQDTQSTPATLAWAVHEDLGMWRSEPWLELLCCYHHYHLVLYYNQ